MMYVQKIDHLPVKDTATLKAVIEQKVKPEKFAMITHDKEVDQQGNPTTPDVHVMLSFRNARYVSAVSKVLGDQPQYIEAWDGSHDNGYAYLVHATAKAQAEGKYQYDPGEVIANFDYPSYLLSLRTKAVQKVRQQDMAAKDLIDAMYVGILTKSEVEQRLTGSQLGYYKRQIDAVWSKVLRNRADAWRQEMREQGKRVTVLWLYGGSGTGKSRWAKAIAAKRGQPYYMSGSSRDIFQDYSGEHTIILDELRPKVMAYQDLLRILDPYGLDTEVKAPARYSDKSLAADLIIVTSPYSPYDFWEEQFSTIVKSDGEAQKQTLADQGPDNFDQLDRRVTLTVEMQQATIDLMTYNKTSKIYTVWHSRVNPYSQQAQTASNTNTEELFNAMFD